MYLVSRTLRLRSRGVAYFLGVPSEDAKFTRACLLKCR